MGPRVRDVAKKFSTMKNVKIKYRIFALSAGALIGMLIFSGYLLIEKRHVSSEMESLNELAREFPSITEQVPHFDDHLTVPFDRETLMEKIVGLSIRPPEPEDLLASA